MNCNELNCSMYRQCSYRNMSITCYLESVKAKKPTENSPIIIFDRGKFYQGTIYETRSSGKLEILDYKDKFNVHVRFLDTGYESVVNMDNIKNGSVKDPYARTAYGGYYGEGPYIANRDMKIYKVWEGVLRRANVHKDPTHPTYDTASVCEEWLNLQTFAKWYQEYRSRLNPESYKELQIDKDIYQWKCPNKIYSPSTCCLIPQKLNSILSTADISDDSSIGILQNKNNYRLEMRINGNRGTMGYYDTYEDAVKAYKDFKKKQILDLGAEYLSIGYITPEVFEALKLIEI